MSPLPLADAMCAAHALIDEGGRMPRHARRTSPSTPPIPGVFHHGAYGAPPALQSARHASPSPPPCVGLEHSAQVRCNQMAIRWQSDGNQMAIRWQSDAIRGQSDGNQMHSEGNQRAISCSNHRCDSSIARVCASPPASSATRLANSSRCMLHDARAARVRLNSTSTSARSRSLSSNCSAELICTMLSSYARHADFQKW